MNLDYETVNQLLGLLIDQKNILLDLFFVWFIIISCIVARHIKKYRDEHGSTHGVVSDHPVYYVFWAGCLICIILIECNVYRGEFGGIVYQDVVDECIKIGGQINRDGLCVPK